MLFESSVLFVFVERGLDYFLAASLFVVLVALVVLYVQCARSDEIKASE